MSPPSIVALFYFSTISPLTIIYKQEQLLLQSKEELHYECAVCIFDFIYIRETIKQLWTEVIAMSNNIIYHIFFVILLTLILYGVRHKYLKSQMKTVIMLFLSQSFLLCFTFVILPYYSFSKSETVAALLINSMIAGFYTIWNFDRHKFYVGYNCVTTVAITTYLITLCHQVFFPKESYLNAWISASIVAYIIFLAIASIVFAVKQIFPDAVKEDSNE